MKNKWFVAGAVVCMTLLAGCQSGVAQEDYDSVSKQYEDEKKKGEELQLENDLLEGQVQTLTAELDDVQKEMEEYKERMQPYEEMEAAEAEARKIAAEKEAKEAKEKEEKEKKEKEEKAAKKKEEEEKQGYETGITYEQLARTPDDYEGKKVKFKGKVLQVVEADYSTQIRLAIDSDYDRIIYCEYVSSIVSSRVLEDDIITVYGTAYGLLSYQSTGSGTITIPSILVQKIDQ